MKKITKAVAIPASVKRVVEERDGGRCIICGNPGSPNAHYIARSHLGLGIPGNIVTLCQECHREYDQSPNREAYRAEIEKYLRKKHPGWNPEELIYKKWRDTCE